jgi:hypothetical protein
MTDMITKSMGTMIIIMRTIMMTMVTKASTIITTMIMLTRRLRLSVPSQWSLPSHMRQTHPKHMPRPSPKP